MSTLIACAVVAAGAGCAGSQLGPPTGEVVPDPAAFAASLRAETLPPTPEQYTFAWSLEEQGSGGVGGRGVLRSEAASRLRLDLFGPRGETYLIAALVDGEYRLPPEAANAVALPSPSLLWAALGVLAPPSAAVLSSATTADATAQLRYSLPDEQIFAYTFQRGADDRFRLARLERAGPRGVLETVSIERTGGGAIGRTRYRDWTAYRDLEFEVQEVVSADPFPSDIWRPDAASR
jgi:hypothetical protein